MAERPNPTAPSQPIQEAMALLQSADGIEIIESIAVDPQNTSRWMFHCSLQWTAAPRGQFPPVARFQVVVPETFPFDEPDFYALDDAFRGFPHQSSETGKLCLRDERNAPYSAVKLLHYVKWVKEWLNDAADGKLLSDGEPYELPDFRREEAVSKVRWQPGSRFYFIEDTTTFGVWSTRVGSHGIVEIGSNKSLHGFVPFRFCTLTNMEVLKTPFREANSLNALCSVGTWAVLASLVFERHRPPTTHAELHQLCQRSRLDYWRLLALSWERASSRAPCGVILWGMPIPQVVGGKPVEVHWQPQFIPHIFEHRRQLGQGKKSKPRKAWSKARATDFADAAPLHWGQSENIASSRWLARAQSNASVPVNSVALLGCGAVGSLFAGFLVRVGLQDLRLFDKESLESGNLVRHVLDGYAVGHDKARALAAHLGSLHPQARIEGHAAMIPSGISGSHRESKAAQALNSAELWIDCALDRGAFLWLSQEARAQKRRCVSIFLSWGAEYLTLLCSGRNTACHVVERRLVTDVERGETTLDAARYLGKPNNTSLVVPGAGCWHATFPASWPDITAIAGSAFSVLNEHFRTPWGCDGFAAVLRRPLSLNVVASQNNPFPLTELIWARKYR